MSEREPGRTLPRRPRRPRWRCPFRCDTPAAAHAAPQFSRWLLTTILVFALCPAAFAGLTINESASRLALPGAAMIAFDAERIWREIDGVRSHFLYDGDDLVAEDAQG